MPFLGGVSEAGATPEEKEDDSNSPDGDEEGTAPLLADRLWLAAAVEEDKANNELGPPILQQ